jgi:hypothetical protein
MDEYSRYPVVETLTTVSTKTVIPLLDKIFSIFGRPSVLKQTMDHRLMVMNSDNSLNIWDLNTDL